MIDIHLFTPHGSARLLYLTVLLISLHVCDFTLSAYARYHFCSLLLAFTATSYA